MADRKDELEKLYAEARAQKATRPSDVMGVEKIVIEEINALEKFKKLVVPQRSEHAATAAPEAQF